ncbi:trigger factor [Candidatus Uhrbacteria bacterium]|nr:MAG: trigger factor [Candidatus Uhrbacteria bacterium]
MYYIKSAIICKPFINFGALTDSVIFSILRVIMHKINRLPSGEVEIKFEIPWEETLAYREEAAKDISKAKPLPGFRPGFATYEDVKRIHGEMAILETALERIVRAHYVKTVLAEKLETVGSPAINIDKLVPGETIAFTTTSALIPEVTKMPDFEKCVVEEKKKEVNDANVEEAIDEMRRMRRVEEKVDRPATMEDLVVIDMEMLKENVPVEGGTGRDYRVYLAEPNYIPGMAEQLSGMKAGDKKTFTLPFPKEHFQKNLAGQDINFKVQATGVYELKLPPADDAFAKGVGIETMTELRAKLKENLQAEHDNRSKEAAEIELLEKLVDSASFSQVPDILVKEEVGRMLHELEHGLEDQGMDMATYLQQIKKTMDELRIDFSQQAIRRVKTAVLIKEVAKRENIDVSEEELDAEIDRILAGVPADQAETRQHVSSPDYRDYVKIQMRNRKTLEWLKKKCVK